MSLRNTIGSADFETTDFAFPQDAVAGLCADAEYFAHLLNEALVQDNLITLQNQCARNTKLRDLVLGVGIGSDTADASVRRETGE